MPALFEPFADLPRPAAYDGFLAHLDEVVGVLSTGTVGPDARADVMVQGETPQVVINSTRDAITSLTRLVDDEQRRLVDALNAAHAHIIANRGSYVADRPALAGATRRTVKSDAFLGDND